MRTKPQALRTLLLWLPSFGGWYKGWAGTTTPSRRILEVAGVARPSRQTELCFWGLNRSDFKIERDHFMHRNRGHIDGDEAVLIRERN